jgi:FkbM family methyltransferase
MKSILRQLKDKLRRLNQWKPPLSPLDNLIKIGTEYGAWVIPNNHLTNTSTCYLVGAGEDISFDVGLAEKYKCHVYIFDPTPRAKKHFDLLIESTRQKKKMPINQSTTDYYDLSIDNIELLHYKEIGLWNKEDEIRFYSPKDPDHVSHSALNLQKTENYFTAKVNRLSEIMRSEGHQVLDLLKINIGGAEYVVLDSIIEDRLKIKVLCVEYDERYNPLDKNCENRIRESIEKLIKYGYKVVENDVHPNYTFVLESIYDELIARNNGSNAMRVSAG